MFSCRLPLSSINVSCAVRTLQQHISVADPRVVANGLLRSVRTMSSSSNHRSTSPLFHYTSGRWVYNEDKRLKERERIFNVDQLQHLAARAVSRRREDVTSIEKLGEGAANRAFVIRFRDGSQVVARIPYPVIEPKGLVVASEAATMTFLRSKGIPVPQVLGYSCTADNPAGTEYIFMEFCSGRDLASLWDEMADEDCRRLVHHLVDVEARLSALHLPASGSLYFLRDLPSKGNGVPIDTQDTGKPDSLYIGSSTGLHFWFGKRSSQQVDRGPFSQPEAAMNAGAEKEAQYLEHYGRPLLPFNRFQRETFNFQKQLPSVHLDSLRKYLQISKHLIPRSEGLKSSILRHPDLRPSNIFVSEDFRITALIDWQHSSALPMFLSAGIPEFLDNTGSQLPDESSELPSNPSDEDENTKAQRLYSLRQRGLRNTYISAVEKHDPLHFEALTYPFAIGRQKIHRLSGDPWQGDNIPLRSSLIFVKQNWDQISSDPNTHCPISFTEEEEQECLRLDDAEQQGVEQLEEFRQAIGLGPEGWVSHDNYEGAKEAIARMKEMSLEQAETEEERIAIRDHWIFDDFDENEYE
ncbi:Altered inheritance of mitochondria protein 9, mitochondrial [Pseudocercospora fuligena]|uniref:Altered inheritance of mitochondria protein 9, mitochondrial n=1 Tax=Pseudocercospora fuligena TaxID=685502 RepID=A0A8H6RU38_9PEZI|nr:Altered inheritance of mitochondria protein 9, mitochondrial [Pseudocercospora fuligena]